MKNDAGDRTIPREDVMRIPPYRTIWLYAILFFFALQLLTDFVGAVYAFGLLGVGIPPELASVALLLSPALLLPLRRGFSRPVLAALQILIFVAAAAEPMLPTRERMLLAGAGLALLLILLPALIWRGKEAENRAAPDAIAPALALAVALSIAVRGWNSGADPSIQAPYRVLAAILAATGAAMTVLWSKGKAPLPGREPASPQAGTGAGVPTGRVLILCLGLMAGLVMLYFAFSSPNVVAGWARASYVLVVALAALALTCFALCAGRARARLPELPRTALLAWNALFVACLVYTLLARSVQFPADPAVYPLAEPQPLPMAAPALVLTCLLYPVVLLDFAAYWSTLAEAQPSLRQLAAGFLVAAVFLLVMIFGQVFTTVYDYIPVVGPPLRDRFWAVFLALGVVLGLPVLALGPRAVLRSGSIPAGEGRLAAGLTTLLCAAAVAGALVMQARPAATNPGAGSPLRVVTYNVQQGYGADGREAYTRQLALLQETDADIVGIVESDTNRISGSNSDIARYFADGLDLHAYYGPKVTAGTFGIALLSRYPLEQPETFYLYSAGEQVAAVRAQITAGGKAYQVIVTHLGNDGPPVQQRALVEAVKGLPNVIMMGDFNFRPDTDQYRLTRTLFDDAWMLGRPQSGDFPNFDPARRIDHIFVSPGTAVTSARYLAPGPSDHPALVAEIQP